MPKNMGKGGKNRKRGTNKNEPSKRDLLLKQDGQEYAQITKMLGNCRLECKCPDGLSRIGVIRGAMRKKVWMCVGDVVILALRDFEDGTADICYKYTSDEVKRLIEAREIPDIMSVNDEDRDRVVSGVRFSNAVDGRGGDDEDEESKEEAASSSGESEDSLDRQARQHKKNNEARGKELAAKLAQKAGGKQKGGDDDTAEPVDKDDFIDNV